MAMSTNPNYLVQIMQFGQPGGAPVTSIVAPIPESVNFEVNSTYDALLPQSFTENGKIKAAAAMMGMRLAVQSMTAQLWTGSTTGDLSFNLEFYTESDPDTDVRTPILSLMKLATPTLNSYGLMQSPGPQLDFSQLPTIGKDLVVGAYTTGKNVVTSLGSSGASIFNGIMSDGNASTTDSSGTSTSTTSTTNQQQGTGASFWKNQVSNRIAIKIGNYMLFDNVVVTHVGAAFTSTMDAVTGLPHHVVVTVSFRPMFTLTQADLDDVFISPGTSTTGNNSYNFNSGISDTVTGSSASNIYGNSATYGYGGL